MGPLTEDKTSSTTSLAHAEAFWRRHVDMGVGSFVVGALALLMYFLLTPQGPNRGALEVLSGAVIAWWIVVFAPVGRWAVTTRWRRLFFTGWSMCTLAVIAVSVALDGGSKSPLGVLLVLPMLFAALTYPPLDVGLIALASEVTFVVLVVSQPAPGASRSLVTGVMLALAGGISLMASVNRFVQERSRARLASRLHELATRDGLTSCLTYRAFREALEAEAARARRYSRPFSLIRADLDAFKTVNDTFGHDVGDAVLQGVAAAFRAGARAPDVVGRVGGDEFAILLPETSSIRAEQVARRLQQHVRGAQLPVEMTVSYGTATWFGPGDDLEDVIHRADQALYAAKHAGRDRLAVWEDLSSLA
jgi:diguanylate cyclase (GGDEF)-like protein